MGGFDRRDLDRAPDAKTGANNTPGKRSNLDELDSRPSGPGKLSGTQHLEASPAGAHANEGSVLMTAYGGLRDAGTSLPHRDRIQRSFGPHNVDHIIAHIGGAAQDANVRMGSKAYAFGEHVVFASPPDLQTAAHEAAHVVQQRQGVSVGGGVGRPGDSYELLADLVAARVVAGESAIELLGPVKGTTAAATPVVQHKTEAEPFVATSGDDHGFMFSSIAQKWMADWGVTLAGKLSDYLRDTNFLMPTPFCDWKSGGSREFGVALFEPFTKLGKTQHYSKLGAVLAPDKLDPLVNAGRDAPTAEKEDPVTGGPIHPSGTAFFKDAVVLEVGKFLVKRIIESLARVMPRWMQVRNQLSLAAESPLKLADRDPKQDEVIASHPMDRFVIAGLANHVTMNFKAYRAANPSETALGDIQFGKLRKVTYAWQHDTGMWNWLRVTDPANATKEEVASALYGDETFAHTITAAPPLFGFTDLDNMLVDVRTAWEDGAAKAKKPATPGDDVKIDAPEQQVQAWGLVPEEVMLSQAANVKPSTIKPDEDGRKLILDRMHVGEQLFQQIFATSKTMPAGGYSNLLSDAFDRLHKRATKVADPATSMAMVVPYDSQTQAQNDMLTKALNGVTVAVNQYKTFEGWPNSKLATQQVGWLYLKVACLSEQHTAAAAQLAVADEQSKLFPVTIMELLLAEIRKVLHTERGKKHGDEAKWDTDEKHDARTNYAEHAKREAKLREGLARVRDKLLQGQNSANDDLKALAKELTDLQNEVSIVADLDAMETAWAALYKDLSVVGVISRTNKKNLAKINGQDGLRQLKGEWEKIYARYRSGDKEGAIKELKEKRPKWEKLSADIIQLIDDNETRNKWVTFAILVGIAVITAGIGAYVEGAAAAAWGATSWATFAVTTGAEAVAFTSMSYLIVEKDPSIGGFFLELGKNLLLFAGLKGLTGKYVEFVGKDAVGTVDTMVVQFVALNTAALVEADVRKYLKTGEHLSMDEVLEISKENAMFMVAAGIATMAARPGLETLKLQGEADVALIRLRNTKKDLKSLAAEIENSKNVDWAKGKDLLGKQRELLIVEEEALQRLEKIAGDEKAAKKAGIDGKIRDQLLEARKAHDQLANSMKMARAISLTEGAGSVRYAQKGTEFDEVVDAWRTKEKANDGTKVTELVTDKTFGARGVEIRTADGEVFRLLERTTTNEAALNQAATTTDKALTADQVATNKAAAEEAQRLFLAAEVETMKLVDAMDVPQFERMQVGADAAGVMNQASMPKAGGGGATPGAGATQAPKFLTISDGIQSWAERGPVNQTPGEVVGPGVDPTKLTTKQHEYVDPKDLALAIMQGKWQSGMAHYRGRAIGSIETQGKHNEAEPWKAPNRKLRVRIEKGGKSRYFYADSIDIATGPGPSAEMPANAVKGGLTGEAYTKLKGEDRIFYGDQAPTKVVPGAKKVVVWGGSGNAAAMAEFFAKAGCDVIWVARKSSKGVNPHFKSEYAEILKKLEGNPPEPLRKELQARKDTLEAYSFAMLPRNVAEAFESPLAKEKIHREIGDLGKIEEGVDAHGNPQVKLEVNGKVMLVDQLIVSLGQEPAAPGAAIGLTKGLELKMMINAEGRLVGLESVDGAVRLLGASFADAKMAQYVTQTQRADFLAKLQEQTAQLPANSKGVGPSLANASANITAANDMLAVKDFKISGDAGQLVLPAGAEHTWPGKVAVFLGGEMGIDPARIGVDAITDGKSGAPVFRVKVGAEELGYFKVFESPKEVATEIAMLTKVKDLKLDSMNVVGEKGQVSVADGSGTTKQGMMMSTAKGTSVDGMLKSMPVEPAQRATAMANLRLAVEKVARGLAEMHSKMADGSKQSQAQKRKDAKYIVDKLDKIKHQLGDAHYKRAKELLDALAEKYIASEVPATGYHGDANVGNFIIDANGKLSTIDIGNMQYSFDGGGKPVGTGAADIGRFLQSLESKRPGALTPDEVKSLTDAFNQTYFKNAKGVKADDLAAATALYRAELEMGIIRSSSPDAASVADTTAVGAVGRLDALLGIPQGTFTPVIPPAKTKDDDPKPPPPTYSPQPTMKPYP